MVLVGGGGGFGVQGFLKTRRWKSVLCVCVLESGEALPRADDEFHLGDVEVES